MRIEVDRNLCEGHALCEAIASDFFSVDDAGNLTLLSDEVSSDDVSHVQDAVLACPVAALRLISQ